MATLTEVAPPVEHHPWCGPGQCAGYLDVGGVRVEDHKRVVLRLGPVRVELFQMLNVHPDGHITTDGSPRVLLMMGDRGQELPLDVAGQIGAALIGAQHLDGHVSTMLPPGWVD